MNIQRSLSVAIRTFISRADDYTLAKMSDMNRAGRRRSIKRGKKPSNVSVYKEAARLRGIARSIYVLKSKPDSVVRKWDRLGSLEAKLAREGYTYEDFVAKGWLDDFIEEYTARMEKKNK